MALSFINIIYLLGKLAAECQIEPTFLMPSISNSFGHLLGAEPAARRMVIPGHSH